MVKITSELKLKVQENTKYSYYKVNHNQSLFFISHTTNLVALVIRHQTAEVVKFTN